MSLVGLLLTAEGSPAERARLSDAQIETLDLLFGGDTRAPSLSFTLRIAAIRHAMSALYRWCPLLREAEKVAADNALCLAVASLDLSRLTEGVGGGPDFTCHHRRSWDAFFFAANTDPEIQERILKALSIKRELLGLTAELEREAARADLAGQPRSASGPPPTDEMLSAALRANRSDAAG